MIYEQNSNVTVVTGVSLSSMFVTFFRENSAVA